MATIERANSRKKVTWLSLGGLILVPALIAGGLLWANWNPQERFHTVNAAIVNLDESVKVNGSTVLLGRQVAAGLMDTTSDNASTNFTWHLETAEGAKAGVADGSYVASITIPKNFSKRATSFSGAASEAQQAKIEVTTSSVTALADPTVAQAISQAAVSTLNKTLTTSYLDNVYVGFNTLSTKLSDMSDGASKLASAGAAVDDGTSSLASGLASAGSGASTLASGTSSLSDGASTLASGAKKLADATSSLPSSAKKLTVGGKTLSSGAAEFASGVKAFTSAISGTSSSPGLAEAAAGLTTGINSAISGIKTSATTCDTDVSAAGSSAFASVIAGVEGAMATAGQDLTTDQKAVLAAYKEAAAPSGSTLTCGVYQSTLSGVATELAAKDADTGYSLSSLSSTVSGGLSALSDKATGKDGKDGLNDGADSFASGVKTYVAGVNKLASALPKLSSGISSLSTGATTLASGAGSLSSGASSLADGVASAASGASSLATGTSKLSSGLDVFAKGVSSGASSIPTYTESERSTLASVVATPVTTNSGVSTVFGAYPAAGLLIILALWIGAIATYVVVRPVTRRAVQSSKSSFALLVQGLWPAAVTAVGATALLTAIASSVLTLSLGRIAALATFTLAAALVFAVVNYALVAAFGGVGRFLSIVLAVLGSATLIISGSPGVFEFAASLSPLTPAIHGFTAIASHGSGLGAAVGGLAAWLILGLVLGFVAVSTRRQARPGVLDAI